jgi:hypothetical protein
MTATLPKQPSLFDSDDEATDVEEPWWVRNPATPLDVKRAKIWRGEHPLSGVENTGHLAVAPGETRTCGTCMFFERRPAQGQDIWPEPKCVFGATRNGEGRITVAPRYRVREPGRWYEPVFEEIDADLQPWFPACKDHQEAEATTGE